MKIKTVDDYLDRLSEKYPGITKSEIRKVLVHGFEKLCGHLRQGREVYLSKNNFSAFFGIIKRDPIERFKYFRLKLWRKLKWLRPFKEHFWDQKYVYFGVTATEHFQYCSFMFDNDFADIPYDWGVCTVCKFIEDIPLLNGKAKYIYRIPKEDAPDIDKRSHPNLQIISSKAELIRACPHVSYKDINPAVKGNYEYL